MKINYISDLHTHCGNLYTHPDVKADVLVVAGDVGEEKYFKIKELYNFKDVIWCNGNHDLWGEDIESSFFRRQKVKIIDDVVFLSCTLWTNFWGEKLKTEEKYLFRKSINDFHRIKGLTINKLIELFKNDLKFLEKNVKKYKDKKVVIVTHFAPSKKCIHKRYYESKINSYFVNNLDKFICMHPNIKGWIHGHCHSTIKKQIAHCEVVCNPRGYMLISGLLENYEFNPKSIIEV